ncbi:MAG: pentapeptide repeat-containing protein [Proteobacteria bacterium]|jgi:uncharacterized protein YjbI with pentapeptide repeats|nr:pentapeptide repeat-containing protein [Pseudomonadota bacterium]
MKKALIKAIQASDEAIFNEALQGTGEKSLDAATLKDLHIGAMRIHSIDCQNTEWEACIFDGTTFDGVDLQGAFFNGCTFHNCTFQHNILAEASFDGCVWQKSSLVHAEDLEAFELTNCQLKDCVLEDLNFLDSTLESLTVTAGTLKSLSGIAELKSVVLRNVTVESFDTSEMELSACTASGCTSVPKGFVACEGKRRRV